MVVRKPRQEKPEPDQSDEPVVLFDEVPLDGTTQSDEQPLPETGKSEPSSEAEEKELPKTETQVKEQKYYLMTSGSFLWIGLGANVVLFPGSSCVVTQEELNDIAESSQSQLKIEEVEKAKYDELKKQQGLLGMIPPKG